MSGRRSPKTRDPLSIVKDCVTSNTGSAPGALLGKGEQGAAYELKDMVVKATKFPNKEAQRIWKNEVDIGIRLGKLGVAPQIQKEFVCEEYGYIVMQRIRTIGQVVPDVRVRDKSGMVLRDNVKDLPNEYAVGWMKAILLAADAGFIHMDNHFDNVGFLIDYTPILFDFGFTQERKSFVNADPLGIDKGWACAFSFYQFLEHAPLAQVQDSIFFEQASMAFNHSMFSTQRTVMNFDELFAMFPKLEDGETARQRLTKYKKQCGSMVQNTANRDLALGCMCYVTLLQYAQMFRYDEDLEVLYDTIYKIRRNEFTF